MSPIQVEKDVALGNSLIHYMMADSLRSFPGTFVNVTLGKIKTQCVEQINICVCAHMCACVYMYMHMCVIM